MISNGAVSTWINENVTLITLLKSNFDSISNDEIQRKKNYTDDHIYLFQQKPLFLSVHTILKSNTMKECEIHRMRKRRTINWGRAGGQRLGEKITNYYIPFKNWMKSKLFNRKKHPPIHQNQSVCGIEKDWKTQTELLPKQTDTKNTHREWRAVERVNRKENKLISAFCIKYLFRLCTHIKLAVILGAHKSK